MVSRTSSTVLYVRSAVQIISRGRGRGRRARGEDGEPRDERGAEEDQPRGHHPQHRVRAAERDRPPRQQRPAAESRGGQHGRGHGHRRGMGR